MNETMIDNATPEETEALIGKAEQPDLTSLAKTEVPKVEDFTSTEAPAIVFTQLYGKEKGQVCQFNITVRAANAISALDQLVQAVAYAKDKYRMTLTRPDTMPAPSPASRPAPVSASIPPQPPSVNTPAAVPSTQPPGVVQNVLDVIRMVVTPNADGKVKLEFFGPGHKYADIVSTRTVEKAIDILKNTGDWSKHMGQVASYDVKFKVYWVNSERLNKNLVPYKDIVKIEIA